MELINIELFLHTLIYPLSIIVPVIIGIMYINNFILIK